MTVLAQPPLDAATIPRCAPGTPIESDINTTGADRAVTLTADGAVLNGECGEND
jgi:hypothetical protein